MRYWFADFEYTGKKIEPLKDKWIDDIHELLVESVENRTEADVPLGLFLSSGVDSSLIAAILKKELDHDVLALTVPFNPELTS